MTLLPFQTGDVVLWRGEPAFVVEVRSERVVVETADGVLHITADAVLREMQAGRRGAA